MAHWAMTVAIVHKKKEEITNQVFLIQVLCLFSCDVLQFPPAVLCVLLTMLLGDGTRQPLDQHVHP